MQINLALAAEETEDGLIRHPGTARVPTMDAMESLNAFTPADGDTKM